MIKVSVIIPAYQVEDYLIRSVSSVLKQTLQEIEIILVNDGSTDKTANLCDELAQMYPSIKVIHQENQGSSKAREVGLAQSTGEYILFLDADDWLDPKACETLYQKAVETEADMVMYQAFLKEGGRDHPLRIFFTSEDEINRDPIFCFLNAQLAPAVWAKFMKHTYLKGTGLNFPPLSYSEDVIITLRLLLARPKITLLEEPLYYYYYQRPNSLVHVINEHCLEIFESLALVRLDLKAKGLYDQYRTQYLHFSELHLSPVRQKVKRNPRLKETFNQLYENWKRENVEA